MALEFILFYRLQKHPRYCRTLKQEMSLKLTRKHDKESKVWSPRTNVSFSTTCLFFRFVHTHTHRRVRVNCALPEKLLQRDNEGVRGCFSNICALSRLTLFTWILDLFFSTLWKSIGVLDKIQPFKNILLQF